MKNPLEQILKPFQYIENPPTLIPRFMNRAVIVKQLIQETHVGAEIGVYKGQFSRFLLDIVQPEQLHLIDPWYLTGKEWDWGKGDRSTVAALTNILREYENELATKKMVLHIGFDQDILEGFPDHYFDWVYLDSSHEYEHTSQELEILSRKVKEAGVIIGDDWRACETNKHYGVHKAVDKFLTLHTDFKLLYHSAQNAQWAISKNPEIVD